MDRSSASLVRSGGRPKVITRQTLIEKAQEVAAAKGVRHLRQADFIRESGIPEMHVYKHFTGWPDFCRAAGLEDNRFRQRISDKELFGNMRTVFLSVGSITTQARFGRMSRYATNTYKKRWGRWQNVLAAFRDWVEDEDPKFPFLRELPPKGPMANGADAAMSLPWRSAIAPRYGEILNFRGLQHAPLNEHGVIFLFGVVASDLGFVVESITSDFPDCEAKRRINGSSSMMERVRIEFEFRSRNFKCHGHCPDSCDLIVCWEDNWPESPVEVLELRCAIRSLSN